MKNIVKAKRIVKTFAVASLSLMVGISAIGCQKADTANNHPSINIDVDANIPNGDKINESQEVVGGSSGQGVTLTPMDSTPEDEKNWKKVKHTWPEPPENKKQYTEPGLPQLYMFSYVYKGKRYWITVNDNGNSRMIYQNNSTNPLDVTKNDRVMIVSENVDAPLSQLLAENEVYDGMASSLTGGKGVRQSTHGFDN